MLTGWEAWCSFV